MADRSINSHLHAGFARMNQEEPSAPVSGSRSPPPLPPIESSGSTHAQPSMQRRRSSGAESLEAFNRLHRRGQRGYGEELTILQKRYADERIAARQAGGDEGRKRLSQSQKAYQADLAKLRAKHDTTPTLGARKLRNVGFDDDESSRAEFAILKKTFECLKQKFYDSFNTIDLDQEQMDPEANFNIVDGYTLVQHPTCDDQDGKPIEKTWALVVLREDASIEEKIVALVHEVAQHAGPRMRAVEMGEFMKSEQEEHFENIYPDSPYAKEINAVKENWADITKVATKNNIELNLDDALYSYAMDIVSHVNERLEHSSLNKDEMHRAADQLKKKGVRAEDFYAQKPGDDCANVVSTSHVDEKISIILKRYVDDKLSEKDANDAEFYPVLRAMLYSEELLSSSLSSSEESSPNNRNSPNAPQNK